VVSNSLTHSALRDLNDILRELSADKSDSLAIELNDIQAAPGPFASLAEMVMRLRRNGVDIQVAAHDPDLTADLRSLPDSRDWLVASGCKDEPGARRALHLDGPRLDP